MYINLIYIYIYIYIYRHTHYINMINKKWYFTGGAHFNSL